MKKISLIILFLTPLFALDMKEAITRAMQYNPAIKEKNVLIKASKEQINAAFSGYKPTLDLSYGYSRFSHKNFVGADSASSADATLRYNLFNGFADKFNIKANEANEEIAEYTRNAAKADLKLQVYLSYVDYLRSKQKTIVAQESIRLLEQQLKDAKNFFEQGIFAKNDYLQVDVELSSTKQALLSSQRDVRVAFYHLKRLLGSELHNDEMIESVSREQKELSPSILREKMLHNRSELKVLHTQKKALHYSYETAASNYYPKVEAEAKYQVAGVDPIPNGGATFQTHDQSTATINLNWNLYQGGADEAKRASLLYYESASNERLNILYLELDFQLEEAIETYRLAQNQIKVSLKALDQAKENFRVTKNQFDANIANTALMLDAQRFLASAQLDYNTAYFALYDAMGKIERVVEEDLF